MTLREKLISLIKTKIQVVVNNYHLPYASHKGDLIRVEEDFIELDNVGKLTIIPISEISSIITK